MKIRLLGQWKNVKDNQVYQISFSNEAYDWIRQNFPDGQYGEVGGTSLIVDDEIYSMLVLWFSIENGENELEVRFDELDVFNWQEEGF